MDGDGEGIFSIWRGRGWNVIPFLFFFSRGGGYCFYEGGGGLDIHPGVGDGSRSRVDPDFSGILKKVEKLKQIEKQTE